MFAAPLVFNLLEEAAEYFGLGLAAGRDHQRGDDRDSDLAGDCKGDWRKGFGNHAHGQRLRA